MARSKFKTFEEAQTAQTEGKAKVREAKQALTTYLKTNKLKRNVDYSKDAKHSKKIEKLEKAVTRLSDSLEKTNAAVKDLKPKKERVSKYDYPEGLTTEEKKKFRQQARSGAKPKKEKAAKKTTAKKSKAKATKKAAPAKGRKRRTKK